MKGFCDSCTEEKEIKNHKIDGIDFYWCEECSE